MSLPVLFEDGLPLWHSNTRGTPNAILRSALFAAVGRGRRKVFKKHEQLASLDGIEIYGMGVQLDQADLDVWQMSLHLAKSITLGKHLEFSAKSFLKAMKRSDGKSDRVWLQESLSRLQSFSIKVKVGNIAYVGSLVHEFYVDENSGRYVISINPKLKSLFDAGWTQVEFAERVALKGKPLAQWLAAFYSTHAQPYPMKVETLRTLCGSNADIRAFRRMLKAAFEECVLNSFLIKWRIEKDLVYVERAKLNYVK